MRKKKGPKTMCKANKNVTYVGAKGALLNACEQVFDWQIEEPLLVIIWHEDWANNMSYFDELARQMENATETTKTLVAFFESSIDACREKRGGHLLPLLFRLLGQDPAYPQGCCCITDFKRLGQSSVPFRPKDPDVQLRRKANEILGLTPSKKTAP